jgi:hypothetical protein
MQGFFQGNLHLLRARSELAQIDKPLQEKQGKFQEHNRSLLQRLRGLRQNPLHARIIDTDQSSFGQARRQLRPIRIAGKDLNGSTKDCVAMAPTPASAHGTNGPTENQCDCTATPSCPVSGSRATME